MLERLGRMGTFFGLVKGPNFLIRKSKPVISRYEQLSKCTHLLFLSPRLSPPSLYQHLYSGPVNVISTSTSRLGQKRESNTQGTTLFYMKSVRCDGPWHGSRHIFRSCWQDSSHPKTCREGPPTQTGLEPFHTVWGDP